jgi:autotransporter-associated beta strand protein
LTLTGTNTFTGNLLVDAGTVTISSIGNAGEASAAGAGSTISIGIPQGTGTLVYTGSAATSNKTIALSGGPGRSMTINQNGTGLLKFTSNVTSTGLGFRTLVLGGNGSGEMAGAIVDSASGTTMTTATAASGSTQLTLASVDGISANSTITGTGIANGTIITALNGNTANLSIATTASVNASSTVLTIPGVINPTGVTKNGTGTWTLSGANTYTGNTTINAGALNIQHANALGTTARGTTVASGAALQLQGDITVGAEALSLTGTGVSTTGALRNISGSNTYGGAITLAGATRINSDADLLTLSGGISGTQNLSIGGVGNTTISNAIATSTGTLTKDGAGTLILTGSNTFTGAIASNSGRLLLDYSNNDVLSTANALTLGGGTLEFKGAASGTTTETLGAVTVTGTTGMSSIVLNNNGGSGVNLTLGAATVNTWSSLFIDLGGDANNSVKIGTAINPTASGSAAIMQSYIIKDATGRIDFAQNGNSTSNNLTALNATTALPTGPAASQNYALLSNTTVTSSNQSNLPNP